jgi:hypothetical protein
MLAPVGRLAARPGRRWPELGERVFSALPRGGVRGSPPTVGMHKAARLFGAGEASGYLSLVSAGTILITRQWRK